MTRLVLIRHGQTDYNTESRYCGFSNPPLNEKGMEQIKRLSFSLRTTKVDRAYSSDLQRASQSARLIFRDLPVEEIQDFREINFGVFEGLRYEEVIKAYPGLYRDWLKYPDKIKIPDGEGLIELDKRVNSRLSSILSENEDKTITLVTHGGPIRVILCHALSFGLEKFWQIEQEIGALNIIDYSKESSPDFRAALIIKMNDTSHLS